MNEDIHIDKCYLERLKRGDTACFEILYNKYSGKLYNFVLRISKGDAYLAEEIVQNVFVKIWEVRSQINTEGSFGAFIYTIGRNMFLNVLKRRIQEYLYHDYLVEHSVQPENSTEKEVEYRMLEERINVLIDQLPSARRNIYILSRVKHLPNKEIAKMLAISENTVESQLCKANHYIRKSLLPYCEVLLLAVFLSTQ